MGFPEAQGRRTDGIKKKLFSKLEDSLIGIVITFSF